MQNIKNIFEEEYSEYIKQERDAVREEASKNIFKIQEESKMQFDKKRKQPRKYKVRDSIAIQKMQFYNLMKLKKIYLASYEYH